MSAVALKTLRNQHHAQAVVEEVFYEVFLKAKEFDCSKARVKEWFVRSAYVRSMNRSRLLVKGFVEGKSQMEGVEETW